ncbi:MAG: cobalamin-binding protein [Parahaliea sp.]
MLISVRRQILLGSLLFSLSGISFCTAAAIEVIDFAGRNIILEKPARRIVALSPHTAENTFSAGAGDYLVGVVDHSDFPEAAKTIPRVGNYKAWSLESIIASQPDLVLMWGSGNGLATLPALERLGIPVYVSEPQHLDQIPQTLRAIGKLAGTSEVAEVAADNFENGLRSLRNRHQRSTSISVFYQVWNQPLQTLSGEHYISELIALCGGYNIFADARVLAPKISIESVLKHNPDVILASGTGSLRPAWLDEWLAYPHLEAARKKQLFFVAPDLLQRPTTRLLQGARELCRQLDSVK